jgi:signal transduction histidine kinase
MAISNVLDNALKFTPQGGEVEIGLYDQMGIQVWVRDTGVGIQPEDLPHIFERFYRGRSLAPGREHAEGGSGLGLAIVKSIVEAHEGEVAVESDPGGGTTIRLIWPAE